MREDNEVENIIEQKKKNAQKNSDMKFKQYESEIDKKRKDEDKIELMTQFMLDPTSSATKLLEKRREMYELQEALQKDKEKFNEKETQFKKTEEEKLIDDLKKDINDKFNNLEGINELDNCIKQLDIMIAKSKEKSLKNKINDDSKNSQFYRSENENFYNHH